MILPNLWKYACIAAISAFALQTIRIEGILFIKGYKTENQELQSDIAAIEVAQKLSKELQEKQLARQEEKYTKSAIEVQNNALENVEKYGVLAANYIAANRVRASAVRCDSQPAAPGPRSGGAPDPVGAGGTPKLVAVTEKDVKVCTDNTAKAEAGHDFAVELQRINEGR